MVKIYSKFLDLWNRLTSWFKNTHSGVIENLTRVLNVSMILHMLDVETKVLGNFLRNICCYCTFFLNAFILTSWDVTWNWNWPVNQNNRPFVCYVWIFTFEYTCILKIFAIMMSHYEMEVSSRSTGYRTYASLSHSTRKFSPTFILLIIIFESLFTWDTGSRNKDGK